MAQIIDDIDPLARIGEFIDFRCGACPSARASARYLERSLDGRKGIEFRCHGQVEFLELSEQTLNVPRRFKGYRPFSSEDARAQWSQARMNRTTDEDWRSLRARLPEFIQGWRPMCGRCQKPVQIVESFRNEARMETVLRFRCHGAMEDVPAPDCEFGSEEFRIFMRRFRPFQPALTPSVEELLRKGIPIPDIPFTDATKPPSSRPMPPQDDDFFIPPVKPRVITLED